MAGTFDTGYSLVPDLGELTADERLEASLSGMVPDTQPDVKRPLGRGWAFDFERNEFVNHGTAPAQVYGLDQLVVWIEKTLRTSRYAHAIYSDDYGMEGPFDAVGKQFTPGVAAALQNSIKDALIVHDRITDVKDFSFEGGGVSHVLLVGFTVVTDEEDIEVTDLPLGGTA